MSIGAQLDAIEVVGMQDGKTPDEISKMRRGQLSLHVNKDAEANGDGTKGQANLPRARRMFGIDRSDDEWVTRFDARPDILHLLLGDIYRVYKAEGQKQAGTYKGGRRPRHIDGNLDELWQITTPQFSMKPFPDALRELMGERSLRQFASRVPMDHRELSRMMRGTARLDLYWLDRIARAGDVQAAYFVEWRSLQIQDTLARVFAERPNLSLSVIKRMAQIAAAAQ